jgi:gliding motility-associated-like protein
MCLRQYLFITLLSIRLTSPSQNQYSKWYFHEYAGLDFMTVPPTILTNGVLSSFGGGGCASQADASGNLLFYTDGKTVYDQTHSQMANGFGLLGNFFPKQGCLIVKKPGSPNLYYIFTVQGNVTAGGLKYSIVDMTLAAGMGSVTIKNAPVFSAALEDKVTGTYACNGTDVWIVVCEYMSANFRSYLLTSSGISSTAVMSSFVNVSTVFSNYMKISPSGNKLAAVTVTSQGSPERICVYDFDNVTGVISNPQVLTNPAGNPFGVEFSPDGSKLYAGSFSGGLYQWNLCAGPPGAIVASQYSLATPQLWALQLAIDGKIYIASGGFPTLGVINNPNAAGSACNFVSAGQSIAPNVSVNNLPNFISRYKAPLVPFTYSLDPNIACHAITFTANLPFVSCAASNYSVNNIVWDFGDPSTGALNASTFHSPSHVYSSAGTFTVSLIFNYKCGADTIKQVINIPPPNLAVTWSSHCNSTGSATIAVTGGIGPYSYSWTPGAQTGSTATMPAGTYTVSLLDQGLSCVVSTVISIPAKMPPSITLKPAQKIAVCYSQDSLIHITGNAASYSWTPAPGLNITGTNVLVNPAASQLFTITGILNSCTATTTLSVNVLPLPMPQIILVTNSLCINSVLTMQGSGGTKFLWEGPNNFHAGESKFSLVMSAEAAGVYTLTVTDPSGCKGKTTAPVNIISPPAGELRGFKPEGCAPFCSDFYFESFSNPNLVSNWQLNGKNFAGKFSYCFNKPGTYGITGMFKDTITLCADSRTYAIMAFDKPEADFTFFPEIVYDNMEDIKFVNTTIDPAQTSWSWFFHGSGTQPAYERRTGETTYNKFSEAGSYAVVLVVSNKYHCLDTLIKPLIVNEDYALYIPDAFSPNDDELNDLFIPVVRGLKLFRMNVFDRWGKLLFETSAPGNGWDGTFKNEPVKEDSYTWKITLTTNSGVAKTLLGKVMLIR